MKNGIENSKDKKNKKLFIINKSKCLYGISINQRMFKKKKYPLIRTIETKKFNNQGILIYKFSLERIQKSYISVSILKKLIE